MFQMQKPFKNIPHSVTTVTGDTLHASCSGLSFADGSKNASRRGPLVCARQGAQQPSPLAPLQASWRGKGFARLGMSQRRRRKIAFSKELRQRSTYTEEIAWKLLRAGRCLGLKFRRQYGISGFIIDFYCFEHRLAVEIDGSSHDGRESYDIMRQSTLEHEGITFIRISADEMETRPEILIDRIRVCVYGSQTSPHSPLQLAWRGVGGEACAPNELTPPSSPSRSEKVERGWG
jgi:very-short-patch-repair endonuclease